jgi:hypothetical protein
VKLVGEAFVNVGCEPSMLLDEGLEDVSFLAFRDVEY